MEYLNLEKEEVFNSKDENDSSINLIERKYVHKEKEENVQLYNLRRSIPRLINEKIFEGDLRDSLEEREFRFVRTYYEKVWIESVEEYKYFLRTIPYSLKNDDFNNILQSCSDKEGQFLNACYSIANSGLYILASDIDEIQEIQLASLFKMRSKLVSDSEKSILASLIEKVDAIEKSEVYYANMFTDPNHDYFFEHQLDHVPGMMIIETARQLIVSCGHVFGLVPTSGYDFVLSKMDIEFKDYLWISYPTRMKVDMKSITKAEEGHWHSCAGAIIFFQEGNEKARINIEGMALQKILLDSIISKKELKKAIKREDIQDFHYEIYLKDENNDIGYFGSVVDLSLKHVMVKFRIPILFSNGDTFRFKIHFDKKDYTHGKCSFKWQKVSEELSVVRFDFASLDPESREEIIDMIKRLNLLREQKMAI